MIRVERERGGERWSKRGRIKNYDQSRKREGVKGGVKREELRIMIRFERERG